VSVGAPISASNGVDPNQPQTTLELPSPPVLVGLIDRWGQNRKAARVLIVIDVSGSMSAYARALVRFAHAAVTGRGEKTMTLYFLVKYLHVLGAIVILGTGTGIAFFMLMAHRSGDALELRPGNARVIHHANVIVDRGRTLRARDGKDGRPGFDGMDVAVESAIGFDPDSHFLFWKPGSPAAPTRAASPRTSRARRQSCSAQSPPFQAISPFCGEPVPGSMILWTSLRRTESAERSEHC